jgi:hypothetical protein
VISASGNNGIISGGSPCSNVSIDSGYIVNGNNGATAAGACNVDVSRTTIAYNAGTAYNASGTGKVFAFATVTPAAANSTNIIHDNTVGNPTYFVSP